MKIIFSAALLKNLNPPSGADGLQSMVAAKFPCYKCGRAYKSGLSQNLKYQCGVDKQFKCDYCLKTFTLR